MRNGVFSLILIGILLGIGACSRNLEGDVFLDQNGNLKKDEGESVIANLAYQVTLDDDSIIADNTESDGTYAQSINKSGTYCVKIASDSLIQTSDGSTSASVVVTTSSLTEDSSSSSTSTESSSSSSDSSSDDSSSDSSEGTTTTTTTSSDSDSSDSAASVKSGEACDDMKGTTLELDVPIAMDYSTAVTSLSDPATQNVSRGDTVTLPITFPQSCTFELLSVPLTLTPQVSPSSAYSSTTGQLNLNSVVAESNDLLVSQPMAINQDPLVTYDLVVKVDEDGTVGDTTITFTPKVDCPDGTVVTLQKQTIAVNSKDDFEVTQSMSGTAAVGETIVVTTTIKSNTKVSYTADNVELAIATPSFTTGQSYDPSCNNSGESATCSFDIASEGTIVLITSYTLPATLNSDTTFTTTASLVITSNGTDVTYTGNSITFSLQKTETEDEEE